MPADRGRQSQATTVTAHHGGHHVTQTHPRTYPSAPSRLRHRRPGGDPTFLRGRHRNAASGHLERIGRPVRCRADVLPHIFALADGSALAFFQFANPDDQKLFQTDINFTPFRHIALAVDQATQDDIKKGSLRPLPRTRHVGPRPRLLRVALHHRSERPPPSSTSTTPTRNRSTGARRTPRRTWPDGWRRPHQQQHLPLTKPILRAAWPLVAWPPRGQAWQAGLHA